VREGGDLEQRAHAGAAVADETRERRIDIGGFGVRGGLCLERGGAGFDAEAAQELRLLGGGNGDLFRVPR
jgi:hypothetical protein